MFILLLSLPIFVTISQSNSCPVLCTCNKISKWKCTLESNNDFINCKGIKEDVEISSIITIGYNKERYSSLFQYESNCKITKLIIYSYLIPTNKLFNNLKYLNHLFLTKSSSFNNDFKSWSNTDHFLKDLNNLKRFEISKFYIKTISYYMFYFCEKVEEIQLTALQVENIDKEAFKNCKNLKKLKIRYNNVKNLDNLAFSGLSRLIKLYLIKNGIQKIFNRNSWYKMSSLLLLDLSGNKLNKIFSKSFFGLINLRNLDLSNNPIAIIYNEAFKGLTNLETLNLFKTKLHTLNLDALLTLKQNLKLITISTETCIENYNKVNQFKDVIQKSLKKHRVCSNDEDNLIQNKRRTTSAVQTVDTFSQLKTLIIIIVTVLIVLMVIIFLSIYCISKKLKKTRECIQLSTSSQGRRDHGFPSTSDFITPSFRSENKVKNYLNSTLNRDIPDPQYLSIPANMHYP